MPVGGEEADELGDQDQRPGRGLREAQAVQHLAGASASDRTPRRPAPCRPAPRRRRRRSPPQAWRRTRRAATARAPGRTALRRQQAARSRWRATPRWSPACCASGTLGSMRCGRCGHALAARAQEAEQRCRQHDERERHGQEEDRDECGAGDDPLHAVLERAPGDPQQRLDDDGEHGRLDADEQRLGQRQLAERRIQHRQSRAPPARRAARTAGPPPGRPSAPCSRQPT